MLTLSDASVLLCSGIMFVTIPTDGGSISDRYTRGVRLDTLNILGFAFQFAVLGIVPICAVRPERTFAHAAGLILLAFAVLSQAVLSSGALSRLQKQSRLDRSPAFQRLTRVRIVSVESRWRAACS